MKKLSVKKLFVPGVYLGAVLSVIGCVALTVVSVDKYLTEKDDYDYTVNGIIDDEVVPVQGDEENNDTNVVEKKEDVNGSNISIIKPYNSDKVSVGRYYYDFEDDAKKQESAIIFYENTYMQNSGVDYVSDEVFDIVSVLDGKVVSIEVDETLGNIVKIEHDKEIVTVYQGIDNVKVKEGDNILQGNVIATSSSSLINSNYNTALHFEVYYKGELIDPENFYNLNFNEL